MGVGCWMLIDRLEDWYQSNCDGDWEHGFGVTIESLDNPGWSLTADLGFKYDYPENLIEQIKQLVEDNKSKDIEIVELKRKLGK